MWPKPLCLPVSLSIASLTLLYNPGPSTSLTISMTSSGVTSQAKFPRKIECWLSPPALRGDLCGVKSQKIKVMK